MIPGLKGTSSIGKNFVFGIDTEDGKEIWGYEIPGDVFSSPCVVDGHDDSLSVP